MAQLTGTTAVGDIVGVAEDVEDVIRKLYPMDTWAFTNAAKKKATNVYHQWQTDALASAVDTNAKIEGDAATYTAASPTVMLGNYTQISAKTVRVSGTSQSVKMYGRAKELARLITKYGLEVKRDIEKSFWANKGSEPGGDSTARVAAGMEAQLYANYTKAGSAGGTTPAFGGGVFTAPTDATTPGTFSETDLRGALEQAWTDGGDPSVVVCGPFQKARIATFAGATAFAGFYNPNQGRTEGAVIGGVSVYVSDFGDHKVVLSRYVRTKTVFCIDPNYVSLAWLRPLKYEELAKTGDASNGQIIGEWTAVCDNPSAHSKITDCTTS